MRGRPRITASQVKYLALEGGGGCGNAYPGALQALADPRLNATGNNQPILQYKDYRVTNIRGFGGASAGGITACVLSCGFDPDELVWISKHQHFKEFFDPIKPNRVFRAGGFRDEKPPSDPTVLKAVEAFVRATQLGNPVQSVKAVIEIVEVMRSKTGVGLPEGFLWWAIIWVLISEIELSTDSSPIKELLKSPTMSAKSLAEDFGFFAAETAWDFIHKCLIIAAARVNGKATAYYGSETEKLRRLATLFEAYEKKPKVREEWSAAFTPGMTFTQHEKIFGNQLAVTGTNLKNLQTHIFSKVTSPSFFVEDAVRLTMSIPGVFKPFVLTKTDRAKVAPDIHDDIMGVYVDGGLLNNIPLHFFNSDPGANPKTLGLRLSMEKFQDITTLPQLLKIWPGSLGVFGSGKSQLSVTSEPYDNYITLDTTPLTLFDFEPMQPVLDDVTKKSRDATLKFFGLS